MANEEETEKAEKTPEAVFKLINSTASVILLPAATAATLNKTLPLAGKLSDQKSVLSKYLKANKLNLEAAPSFL